MKIRHLLVGGLLIGLIAPPAVHADIVQDWNDTLCTAAEIVVTKHNPGVPTRAMAMMNGSIYDAFQAINRTHAPFKVNTFAPGASVDAAVSQAAYRVLSDMYPEVQPMLDSTLMTRLGAVPNGAAKTAGINLGNSIAQQYITSHQNDGWDLPDAYTPIVGPGHWSTDPMVGPAWIQKGWGSDWGSVHPWAMQTPDDFDSTTPFHISDMNTQRYTDAYNEVKAYGSRNSAVRTADQTAIGLFWAYDRPGTGAPPVLFIENMVDIGNAVGNTPAQNARMFAMASVSLADSIIAAWDTKYEVDLWRPITAIREGANDGNPAALAERNSQRLAALACGELETRRFVHDGRFSPAQQTALVDALVELAPASGCNDVLELATAVRGEIEARWLVAALRMALVAAGDAGGEPRRLALVGTSVVLRSDGARPRVVLPLPADWLQWTPATADFFAAPEWRVADKTVLISGQASPIARRALARRGFSVVERQPFDGAPPYRRDGYGAR